MYFNPVQLIIKKRNGEQLSEQELSYMFNAFAKGKIPDYQMAAFLMSIYFREMEIEEVKILTDIYIKSGESINFPDTINTVDKHSTGGVGDKISIILGPLVAACGAKIPMISGRGLAHTGGTLDKLESIPGFKTHLSKKRFIEQVEQIGLSIIGQSEKLVPVDRVTYALRDVTGTVDSLPLITASIMSKKIAEGARNLVIDLKVGSGAFLKDLESAKRLGEYLIKTGSSLGQRVTVVYTNMNSPLGNYIGNALEVKECIDFLKGKRIPDLDDITRKLALEMLKLVRIVSSDEEGLELIDETIESGKALAKLAEFISAQGGNSDICHDISLLPSAKFEIPVIANRSGWIKSINCEEIGYSLIDIKAGRKTLKSKLDHSTGAFLPLKIGDKINVGDEIGKIFCNHILTGKKVTERIWKSYYLSDSKVRKQSLIYEIINDINY